MKTKIEKVKKSKRFKTFINEVLNLLPGFLENSKKIVVNNKLFIFYVIGAVINGVLLRYMSLGEIFKLTPLLSDLLFSLIFASLYFFLNRKDWYLIFISFISSFVCIANAVYYFYYQSFASITFISFAITNHDTGGANVVGGLFQMKFLLFLIFPIILILIKIIKIKRNKQIKICYHALKTLYIWILLLLLIFLSMLKPVDYSRIHSQWNREYLVSKVGIYFYQINDVVKSLEPKMATLFGSDKAFKEINDFYEEYSIDSKDNAYTGVLEDKNVIAIHAESIQNVLIDMEINGVEITPNLNKLAHEGLYFSNFYSQAGIGTSSDTEFTLATSLMPAKNGIVFINYYNKTYPSFYKVLSNDDYYIFSMHANTGDFWNRNIMHKNLGYDYFYEKSSYEMIDEELIGFGLSDKEFINQSVEKIKEIDEEYDNFYGTLITLSNHTPFDYNELFEKLDMQYYVEEEAYPYLEGTKLGNYFVSAHYADAQLGLLIDLIESNGLSDDTVVMIYGDHDAKISTNQWKKMINYDYETNSILDSEDENYQELDYYWQEINRKVPLIIWSSENDFKPKEITTVMGMYDIAPTLGNMMGFEVPYAMGHDIFNLKDNLVPFTNGNFVTNRVFYNENRNEYKLLVDEPLEEDYISYNKEYSKDILHASDGIIVYNYFYNIFNNELKEEK